MRHCLVFNATEGLDPVENGFQPHSPPLVGLHQGAWGHAFFSVPRIAGFTPIGRPASSKNEQPYQAHQASTTGPRFDNEVLNCIVVPQMASIKIFGGNSTPQNTSLSLVSGLASSLSAFISYVISEDNHPMFYQELNAISTSHELELTRWRSDCRSDRIRRTSSPDLDLSIYNLFHSSGKVLQEFSKRLPLSKLKSLGLTVKVCKDVLVECFGDLQQLQSITLKGSVTRGFR